MKADEVDWAHVTGLLSGQVAVVTGAGRGNGEGIAQGLAGAGAAVAVLDVDEEAARAVASQIVERGGKATAFGLDVTDLEACERVAAEVREDLGQVSILVNNAGVMHRIELDEPDFLGSFETQYDINVRGYVYMARAFVDQLLATSGTIINVGSTACFVSPPKGTGYAVSKGAVLQLTRGLASELGPRGVRVNGIAPDAILTRMSLDLQSDPQKRDHVIGRTPLRKFGKPSDVAGPVIFLASQLAGHVTGAMIPVDGGRLAQ